MVSFVSQSERRGVSFSFEFGKTRFSGDGHRSYLRRFRSFLGCTVSAPTMAVIAQRAPEASSSLYALLQTALPKKKSTREPPRRAEQEKSIGAMAFGVRRARRDQSRSGPSMFSQSRLRPLRRLSRNPLSFGPSTVGSEGVGAKGQKQLLFSATRRSSEKQSVVSGRRNGYKGKARSCAVSTLPSKDLFLPKVRQTSTILSTTSTLAMRTATPTLFCRRHRRWQCELPPLLYPSALPPSLQWFKSLKWLLCFANVHIYIRACTHYT